MKRVLSRSLLSIYFLFCGGCCDASGISWTSLAPLPNTQTTFKTLKCQARDINPRVLYLALNAYNRARHEGYDMHEMLTVIDFSKPSYQRRFWVFDLRDNRLLFDDYVAHGKNSGDVVPMRFSNQMDSLESSIGVYATEDPYYGQLGYALHLKGLEPGFNDNARERAIVIHGAWYVTPQFIHAHGRTGHSWGCPALNPDIVHPVINAIAHGTIVFAYYPEKSWLRSSRFLNLA